MLQVCNKSMASSDEVFLTGLIYKHVTTVTRLYKSTVIPNTGVPTPYWMIQTPFNRVMMDSDDDSIR